MRKLLLVFSLSLLPVSAFAADAGAPAKDAAVVAVEAPTAPVTPPVVVDTPTTPETVLGPTTAPEELSPEEVLAIGTWVIKAIRGGEWGLAIAGILMVLVWVIRKFIFLRLPSSYMPWVAAGLGAASAIAANLQAGQPWLAALISGLMVGLASSGLWSLIGKKLLSAAEKKPDEGAAEASG